MSLALTGGCSLGLQGKRACQRSSDCDKGFTCQAEQCRPTRCSDDHACGAGFTCDDDTAKCIVNEGHKDAGGTSDAGSHDASTHDAGNPDAGTHDAATHDAGIGAGGLCQQTNECSTGLYCASGGVCRAGCDDTRGCEASSHCDVKTHQCVCDADTAQCVKELAPGSWFQVPNSKLEDVAPSPLPEGSSGLAAVISAWSGAAFDSKRDRLLVWGGGGSDYSGNEIYAFDLTSWAWSRLSDPSPDVGGDAASGYYPDDNPRARSTFDALTYVPPIDRFCSFSGGAMYGADGVPSTHVDCFDPVNKVWERERDTPTWGTGMLSAFDTKTGHVFVHGGGSGQFLSEYDPLQNTWQTHSDSQSDGFIKYEHTADIDPEQRMLVAVGNKEVLAWKLATSGKSNAATLKTKGHTEAIDIDAPGFVYVAAQKQFVLWRGGAEVYTFDLASLTWEKRAPAAGNLVSPSDPSTYGTFGRFAYSARLGLFVLVNAVDENVFVYRMAK